MSYPIRCYSCCKVIGHLHDAFRDLQQEKGLTRHEAFVLLKIRRSCCQTRMMAAVDAMSGTDTEDAYAGDTAPPFENLWEILEHLAETDTKDSANTGGQVAFAAPSTPVAAE